MMTSESQLVADIIKGLMTPDNKERNEAEAKLMDLMKKNKMGLVLCLCQILNSQSDPTTLTYCAVIARKLIKLSEDETYNPSWKEAPSDLKEQIKTNIITALINCKNKSLKKKLSYVVGNLYESVIGCEEKWETVLKFIADGFALPLTPENSNNIETAVYLLAKVYNLSHKELSKGIDIFINGFIKYFKEGELDLKTNSVEAICEILSGYIDKTNSKKFKDLMIYILQTILQCFEKNDINNLKIALFALSDLAQAQPALLKKGFGDIFILMGKIIEKKELDEENLRDIAYEILISIIEIHPKVITEDKEKLNLLINSIYRYAMEMEDTIDNDWLTPKSTSLSEEQFIPEDKLDEAISLIERLILGCKNSVILPIISKIVMELLNHEKDSWKFKYIAYVSVGKIAEHVEKIKDIEPLIPRILNDIKSENPKIRYSCLYCISQFSSALKDEFTELYVDNVLPTLLELVTKDTVLRCKLQGYDSLEAFVEESSQEIMDKYTQQILEALFYNFLKPDTECPQSLRETIIDCLGEVISCNEKNFAKYSPKVFDILINYLGTALKTNNTSINLFGFIIEIVTKVGKDCPDKLKSATKDIAQALIHFQNNINDFKGEYSIYFTSAWERILPYIKTECSDLINPILDSIINVITKPPEMSLSNNPEKTINIQEFLSEASNPTQKVVLEKKKISIVTSETEEYSAFIDLLNIILTELKEFAFNFVGTIETQAKKIISYPNIDVRGKAATIFPKIIDIVEKTNKANLAQTMKNYLALLVTAAETETENEVVTYFLTAIEDCINQKILTKDEVNQLFTKLFGIFDKVEKNRIELNKEENKKEKELEEKKNKPKDEDLDEDYEEEEALDNIKEGIEGAEDIITSFSDVIGKLFKTHKELCNEIAEKLIKDVLPKYFNDNASRFEKKMGLFILDDMVEFLGQELLEKIWDDIAKILITYTTHQASEIRQAASYGLGEFIKHTEKNYSNYSEKILEALYKALEVTEEGQTQDEYLSAQDNVVTSIGKIIKFRAGNYNNIKEIIQKWVENLPITKDLVESPGQHELLCDIVMQKSELIMGEQNENLPKVLQILCKIIDSKYSNKEIDAKIIKIFDGVKSNASLVPLVAKAKENASKKVLKNIEKYFA